MATLDFSDMFTCQEAEREAGTELEKKTCFEFRAFLLLPLGQGYVGHRLEEPRGSREW